MAGIKYLDESPADEPFRSQYESWVADTHQKNIPLSELFHHPENFKLVGRIDADTRKALKEDIKKNKIREPLAVWLHDGKLLVVSGNERLDLAKELKLDTVPCIKKEFETDAEARRFIFSVNKNRKTVKVPGSELIELLFPPKDYPLLYADLRANFAYNSTIQDTEKSDNGAPVFTIEEQEKAKAKRKEEREEQDRLRELAAKETGRSKRTIDENAQDVRKKKKTEKVPANTKLTSKDKAKIKKINEMLKANLEKQNYYQDKLKDLKKKEKGFWKDLRDLGQT